LVGVKRPGNNAQETRYQTIWKTGRGRGRNRRGNCKMMAQEKIQFTPEDVRYLKVAIALALGSDDIREMPKSKLTLNELYHKIERTEGNDEQWHISIMVYEKTTTHVRLELILVRAYCNRYFSSLKPVDL
jgi:hypothetical protein